MDGKRLKKLVFQNHMQGYYIFCQWKSWCWLQSTTAKISHLFPLQVPVFCYSKVFRHSHLKQHCPHLGLAGKRCMSAKRKKPNNTLHLFFQFLKISSTLPHSSIDKEIFSCFLFFCLFLCLSCQWLRLMYLALDYLLGLYPHACISYLLVYHLLQS